MCGAVISIGRTWLLLSATRLLASAASPPAFVALPNLPNSRAYASGGSIFPPKAAHLNLGAVASGSESDPPLASADAPPEDPAAAVLRNFRDAIEGDPADAAARLGLGVALRRSGELTLSHEALLRATELSPDDCAECRYQLGLTCAEMGLVEEAADAFRTVLAFRPRSRNGTNAEGGRRNETTTTTTPDPAEVALAHVLLDGRGEKEGARRVFERACASGEPGPVSLLAGLTAASCGDYSASRKYLEDAVRFDPRDVDAALHLMVHRHLDGNDRGAADMRRRLPDDASDSWDYVLEAAPDLVAENPASLCYFTHDMMELAMDATAAAAVDDVDSDGLLLEFGVFHGKTIRMIASRFPDSDVHGFDTFSGLPEDWRGTPRGAFSTRGVLPPVPDNVRLHVGLFSDTLPAFLRQQNPGSPVRLMNIDCDLYSSTRDVFDAVHDRVVPGTVIVFDEYVMNPRWRDDEFKAFQEAVQEHGWTYKYIGVSLATGQAVVQITDT